MSFLTLVEQSTTPQLPTSGKDRIYINSSGNLCSVNSAGAVIVYSAGITTEQVQDIVGALVTDTASVNATYDDAGNILYFDVLPGGVDHNSLLNFVANKHIDHSAVSISAGTGLSGGGDLTTTRTLNIANTGVSAATYGSASQVPQIAINAQGQATSASNVSITPAAIGAQPLDGDLTAVAALAGTGLVTRTATNAMTVRTITAGDAISVTNGDGVSGNPIINVTLTSTPPTLQNLTDAATAGSSNEVARRDHTHGFNVTGVIPGTYGSSSEVAQVTANSQGQVTFASNVTITPAAIGAQPLDADLTSIAGLATTGILTRTASNTYVHRAVAAGTGIAVTNGDGVSGNPSVALGTVGTAGTYGNATNYPIITTDVYGRVTTVTLQPVAGNEWQEEINTATLTNNSNVTLTNITDLGVSVVAGRRYRVEVFIRYSSANTNTGIALTLGGISGATGTITGTVNTIIAGDGTAALYSGAITSLGDLVISTGVPASGTDYLATIQAVFVCTGTGTLLPQFRSENNGTTITVQVGSNILAREWA